MEMISGGRYSCYDPQGPPRQTRQPANPFRPAMNRRLWIATALLALPAVPPLLSGCSSSSKSGKKTKSGSSVRRRKGTKRAKPMTNLLLPSYIDDLKAGSAEKKIFAAKELGNMGASAKSAISALQALKGDADSRVSAAAAEAIRSISK